MYAELDKKTGELSLSLPPELEEYFRALNNDIIEEFAFESMNKATLERINAYIVKWFSSKGIDLPVDDRK